MKGKVDEEKTLILAWREALGLTQVGAAKLLGMSAKGYIPYEREVAWLNARGGVEYRNGADVGTDKDRVWRTETRMLEPDERFLRVCNSILQGISPLNWSVLDRGKAARALGVDEDRVTLLAGWRVERGLSEAEAAEALGVHIQNYRASESGVRPAYRGGGEFGPSKRTLYLCQAITHKIPPLSWEILEKYCKDRAH